jgi:hypothetical protein
VPPTRADGPAVPGAAVSDPACPTAHPSRSRCVDRDERPEGVAVAARSAIPVAVSVQRRAASARVRRNGGTQVQAAAAARVNIRTQKRWEKEPDFHNMIQAKGVLAAGPIRVQASHDDALDDVQSDHSIFWIATGDVPEVLGSLVVADATHARAVFIEPADVERVRDDVQNHRFPLTPDARQVPLQHLSTVSPTCHTRGIYGA